MSLALWVDRQKVLKMEPHTTLDEENDEPFPPSTQENVNAERVFLQNSQINQPTQPLRPPHIHALPGRSHPFPSPFLSSKLVHIKHAKYAKTNTQYPLSNSLTAQPTDPYPTPSTEIISCACDALIPLSALRACPSLRHVEGIDKTVTRHSKTLAVLVLVVESGVLWRHLYR